MGNHSTHVTRNWYDRSSSWVQEGTGSPTRWDRAPVVRRGRRIGSGKTWGWVLFCLVDGVRKIKESAWSFFFFFGDEDEDNALGGGLQF